MRIVLLLRSIGDEFLDSGAQLELVGDFTEEPAPRHTRAKDDQQNYKSGFFVLW